MHRLGGTHAHSRFEAELEELTRVLRSYGVLTGDNLKQFSRAALWSGPRFERVLTVGIEQGRIRRLGDDLYELAAGHRS